MSTIKFLPSGGALSGKGVRLSNFVHEIAQEHPFAIAAITRKKPIDYASLNTLVWKAAGRFLQAGIGVGDTVGFRFQNQFIHMVFALAALRSGIAQVSIFRGWPDKLSNDFVRETATTIVFGEDAWPEGGAEIHAVTLPDLAGDPEPKDFSFREVPEDIPILYVLGSGTTGNPRILHYDSANLAAMAERDLRVRPIEFQERFYSMVAVDFFTGKRRTLGCLAAGGTVIFAKKPASVSAMCDYLGVDHLALVVNHAEFMAEKFTADRPRLPRLKSLVIGGSPISEDLRQRLRKNLSPNLFIGYGTNEFGEATFAGADIQVSHPGTVGMPAPGVEVKIVDSGGEELPAETTGEVLLRAEGMFSGYLNEPEATAKVFQDGWYRPGDLGALTLEGALMFKGRSDDLMQRDGINIYPREIEQLLESHQGVKEAAALPLHSEKSWQLPVVFVTLRDASLTPEILRNFCWDNIGPKLPEHVWTIEQMPRNAAGKILKSELLKRAEKELSQ